MGLVSGMFAPVRGIVWLAEQVRGQAAAQEQAAVRAELDAIDRGRRSGALSAEESAAREDAVLRRLTRPGGEDGA